MQKGLRGLMPSWTGSSDTSFPDALLAHLSPHYMHPQSVLGACASQGSCSKQQNGL